MVDHLHDYYEAIKASPNRLPGTCVIAEGEIKPQVYLYYCPLKLSEMRTVRYFTHIKEVLALKEVSITQMYLCKQAYVMGFESKIICLIDKLDPDKTRTEVSLLDIFETQEEILTHPNERIRCGGKRLLGTKA